MKIGWIGVLVLGWFLITENSLAEAQLKHQYYLLAETGYQPMCVVDVHVNGEHILVVEPEIKKEIVEITSFVKTGENEVVFETESLPDEGDDYGNIDIQIGSGSYKNGQLQWEAVSVHYTVNRAQVKKEKKDILTVISKFNAS